MPEECVLKWCDTVKNSKINGEILTPHSPTNPLRPTHCKVHFHLITFCQSFGLSPWTAHEQFGYTALFHASYNGRSDIMQLLREAGAQNTTKRKKVREKADCYLQYCFLFLFCYEVAVYMSFLYFHFIHALISPINVCLGLVSERS